MGFGTLRRPGEMAFVLIVEPYGTSLPETIGHHRIGADKLSVPPNVTSLLPAAPELPSIPPVSPEMPPTPPLLPA